MVRDGARLAVKAAVQAVVTPEHRHLLRTAGTKTTVELPALLEVQQLVKVVVHVVKPLKERAILRKM